MAGEPAAVLSPHLDDAVLSCWSVLSRGGEVLVVNVLTDAPEPGRQRLWDELTGAADPAERMRERLAEDRAALALAGREPVNLGFRAPADEVGEEEVGAALRERLPEECELHVPAGIGGHPAHLLVRRVGLALAGERRPAWLYADLPYAVRWGWPAWVSGAEEDPCLRPDAIWAHDMEGASAPGIALEPHVRRLDPDQAASKLAAMRTYRTQFPAVNGGPLGIMERDDVLRQEVSWRVVGAKLGS